MFALLLGIASWIALAGFGWLLLACFEEEYDRRVQARCAEIVQAAPPCTQCEPEELTGMAAGPEPVLSR
jgi:hypothetical protein